MTDPGLASFRALASEGPSATRKFAGADCRAGWLITADEADTSAFLGPWEQKFLTFCDPERKAVQGLGLESLPALIHIGGDLTIIGKAEGWEPNDWRVITNKIFSKWVVCVKKFRSFIFVLSWVAQRWLQCHS